MNRLSKLLLVASLAIMITGIGLAVAQPGSLGDEDASEAFPAGDTTTTATDGDDDEQAAGTTTAPPATAAPSTSVPATSAPTTATTAPSDGVGNGSGVGSDGVGSGEDDSDDLADTGGESLIVLGLALGAAGMVLRREQAS